MKKAFLTSIVLLCLTGCAMAEPADMKGKALTPDTSIDNVLDAMDLVGRDLKDFTAGVAMNESDLATARDSTRSGRVWVQLLPGGDARVRIQFDKHQVGKRIKDEKIEYVLDKGWLVERNYKEKKETLRQVLKPGQKLDLLKLGEGPFPLPIGQKKEDVKAMFDVQKIPAEKEDPANTVHLELTPKQGTSFARQFKRIDVWVDNQAHMPTRISTLDKNETKFRTTDLKDIRVNPGLQDADFELSKVEGDWDKVVEEYQE